MSDRTNNIKFISPIILKLRENIKNNKNEAVSEFWDRIEKLGTPISKRLKEIVNII
ncbi:MAG: hypothetical protein ACFFFB_24320 [Candidatus Heimdallarchaeota archaeon]